MADILSFMPARDFVISQRTIKTLNQGMHPPNPLGDF